MSFSTLDMVTIVIPSKNCTYCTVLFRIHTTVLAVLLSACCSFVTSCNQLQECSKLEQSIH